MSAELNISSSEHATGFTAFDVHFSKFITGLDHRRDPAVQLAAAVLSRVVRLGDSCLDLEALAGRAVGNIPELGVTPGLDEWIARLRRSRPVGRPGENCPLILDARNRLYLYRYWHYEQLLAGAILQRVVRPVTDFDATACRRALAKYFPHQHANALDGQKAAAAAALTRYFCIITGGPGTGKTFTIARLLALYCELYRHAEPRIHLAAPTGKAAAQLKASIAAAKSKMNLAPAISNCIPDDVYTLHRLLRVLPRGEGFYYHAQNMLPTDFLVVDEASMVDLALMSKLVTALPADARLILVGDKDQLASVEAGSVLGDICDCSGPSTAGGSEDRLDEKSNAESLILDQIIEKEPSAALSDAIVVLRRNYRFGSESGLGALSKAVRSGESQKALDLLGDPRDRSLQWVDYQQDADIRKRLSTNILNGFKSYLQAETVLEALIQMQRFQILCALRRGPYGAEGINRMTESVLVGSGLIDPGESEGGSNYPGRPVIISRNDYSTQLFNGDIGLIWPDGDGVPGQLNTYFPDTEGGVRKIWPHRLPPHETVYAMTVHKSQGSEFDHVMLILPPRDSELLTRELIYTAITRARRQVTVWAPEDVLLRALNRRLERSSGLRDALWGKNQA